VTLPLNNAAVAQPDQGPKPAEDPSWLVKSVVGAQQLFETDTTAGNHQALVQNLEDASKKSILVVEDEAAIRFLVKETLQETYIVYEAATGQMAIDLLTKIKPTLIVSDVLMPDMNGLQLCATVKNTVETCHIPVLLLSARGTPEQKVEGFEAGADGYLTKPYSATALLGKIAQMIAYRENVQQFLHKDHYFQTTHESGLSKEDAAFLDTIIRAIHENISNAELDAAYLEKQLGVSKMSLYRKLKKLSNMTPAEMIRHIRLKQAALLLRTTNQTVSEIYYQTGFNNQSYFYREFKKTYLSSPQEFREQHRFNAAGR
jgi:YesN/AraC family two-component response regulator